MLRFNPNMSSPTRQVSVRRLPPLPNQAQIKPILKENGVPLDDCRNRHSRISACLTELQIKDYLAANPNVLDELILDIASREQLERWLIRKTHLLSTTENNNDDKMRTSLSKWKFCVHTDKRKMLQQLTRDINQQPKKARVMYELIANIAKAIHADKHSLYLVDKNGTDIYLYSEAKPRCKSLCRQPMSKGGTIAAYVAETWERLLVKDILGDERFPKGIGIEDSTAQSVLCQPIIQADGTLVGIVELVKSLGSAPFEKEDEEILNSYLVWGSIAIHHAEISKQVQKQKDLNTFLLNVVRSIFDEVCTMDVVIEKIMAFAKKLVNADRCSLFLLDTKSNELYANLFDDGSEDGSFRPGKEIRFSVSKGIAGYVACTGTMLNIRDAYRDERFNREVDMKTGYTTRSILCVPVRCKGSVIGVVQMVNSHNGFFSEDNTQAFEMFAGYCGLALHYSKMYSSLSRAQQKHQVALEVISYHCCAAEKEADEFLAETEMVEIPHDFLSWEFDIYTSNDLLTHYFIKMTKALFDQCDVRVDLETIARFALSTRKCYRDVPYHNWCHAFSVAHSLFYFVRNNDDLTNNEKLSLYIAGICHDVDHRGKNNAFMLQCKTPLANLYTTSTMEWHHFKQGVFILESEGQNIFGQMDSENYRNILELMQEAIIATDLMLFFGRRHDLEVLKENGTFSFSVPEHRSLVRCLLMTACDLCTSAKPWAIQVSAVNKVFEEFYSQGDEEKKMGVAPLPIMDRARHEDLPDNQVGFLKGIVIPCFSLLGNFIPELDTATGYVYSNLRQWEKMATARQTEQPDTALVPEEERLQRSISFIDY